MIENDDIPDELDQDIAKAIEKIPHSRPSARGIARKRAKELRLIGRKHGYQAVADIINRHAERPVTARTAEQFVSQKLREDEARAEDEAKRQERDRPKPPIPVGLVDSTVRSSRWQEQPAAAAARSSNSVSDPGRAQPGGEGTAENIITKSDDV